ncbi:GAF domain-containing SpoIIE family protein phosphatase [Streptomyces sp. NPDC007861]|uniref:PP2C family protein-serine/threonine phosphatase n=1 Tax=Streptomyces sp. NPDC007861 TaxID=3154893 RepID=UPI00340C4F0A
MAADRRDWFQGRHGLRTSEADSPGAWALEDALRDTTAGTAVLGIDLRYLFANPSYCLITGEPQEHLAGRSPGTSAEQYLGPAEVLASVLDDGIPRTRVTGPGGGFHTTCIRMENRGSVTGVLCIVVETEVPELYEELELARIRLAAADEAAERIGTSLDEATTCRELVEFLSPRLAEAAAVDVVAPPPPGGSLPRNPGPAELTRAATAGVAELFGDDEDEDADTGEDTGEDADGDADGREGHGDGEERRTAGPAVAKALASGVPVAEHGVGARAAVLAVPLTGPGKVFGVVQLARTESSFSGNDTLIARDAARRAGVAIGHAREFAAEQQTTVELQRALLTEPGKPHPNLEFATRYLPVGSSNLVGGDWFETVRLHYGRTLLVMGDVMGHGVDAAVEMNTYRAMLRDVAAADLPPHRVLRQLDIAISETSARPATCLLVRVDPARGIGSFSSAGHLPPVVFTGDGTVDLLDVPAGPPLGTGLGGYELVTRELTPDDTLLLFTDGLVERRDEDIDESLARLTGLRMPCTIPVDELVDQVVRELGADKAEDDVALLAARIRRRHTAAEEQPVQGQAPRA